LEQNIGNTADVIAGYENKHNIPEAARYTMYIKQRGCYILKASISPVFIQRRYEEACEQLREEKEKNPDIVGVMEVVIEHNLKDVSRYSVSNFDKMTADFFNSERSEKRIGVQYRGHEPVYILLLNGKNKYPVFIDLPLDIPLTDKQIKEIEAYRYDWLIKYAEYTKQSLIQETQCLINMASSSLSARQPKLNYDREIKKRMKRNNKIFINERMEDFDFRSVDLSGAIFINCVLCHANFAHVNMCNVLFINCNLTGAVFLGAMLNNAYEVSGGMKQLTDIYKKYTNGGVQ